MEPMSRPEPMPVEVITEVADPALLDVLDVLDGLMAELMRFPSMLLNLSARHPRT